jgi:FkbM family methyltransferase
VNELIEYRDCSVIVDVGANIGLFLHFVATMCTGTTIYSLEPIPHLFEILKRNSEAIRNHNIHLFNCGLSSTPGEAEFHFFPHCAARSTMYVHGSPIDFSPEGRQREKDFAIRTFDELPASGMRTAVALLPGVARSWLAGLAMRAFARHKRVRCPLKTLSQLIADNGIEEIDILKIDVEGSEAEILKGIDAGDWPKIRQMMVEVHESAGDVHDEVIGTLESRGYRLSIDRNPAYPIPMIFASR